MKKDIPEDLKNKIIQLINIIFPDVPLYLFGSRARGDHHQWSDIDLALDGGKKLDEKNIHQISDILSALNIPYKIDIVDIYAVSSDLHKEIMKDRILWKL